MLRRCVVLVSVRRSSASLTRLRASQAGEGLEFEPMDDDGYVSPVFDVSSDDSDDDGARMYDPNKAVSKKKRRTEEAPKEAEIDLEALALRALSKR